MQKHFNLSDSDFEKQFENCKLSVDLFSHEAHLRLVWIHIEKYGYDKALENIQNQLEKYVAFVGASQKYHITLTIAAVNIVHNFMLKSNSNGFRDFILEYPELTDKFQMLLYRHYSPERINSTAARTEYIEPDLLTFDGHRT